MLFILFAKLLSLCLAHGLIALSSFCSRVICSEGRWVKSSPAPRISFYLKTYEEETTA